MSLLSDYNVRWIGTVPRVVAPFVAIRLQSLGMGDVANKADSSDKIRPADAARKLGVSVRTLARWEASGRLKAVLTAGGHRRYLVSDITRLAAVEL